MTPGTLLATVTRRDVATGVEHVESVHTGHLVITTAAGELVAAVGDPAVPLFVRSTVKPLQATACLEILAETDHPAAHELSDAEVAVAWASHRGEPRHLDAVHALLGRAGLAPDELTCPPAVPAADRRVAASRLTHNCSGKHALFALAGAALGLRGGQVIDPSGALQRRVLGDLDAALGGVSAVGVDGCGAPAVQAPLSGLAAAFAQLASDDRYERVRAAGIRHPGLVGGEGRLETALLGQGVVAKVGAEGSYGIGWVARDGIPYGLAVRAADGAVRGASIAAITLLVDAGVVPAGTWAPPPPLGGGASAGSVLAAEPVSACAERLLALGVGR